MTAAVEQRIARVARERGISFYAAAAIVGRRGARLRAKRFGAASAAERLTAVRKTWSWARDFE